MAPPYPHPTLLPTPVTRLQTRRRVHNLTRPATCRVHGYPPGSPDPLEVGLGGGAALWERSKSRSAGLQETSNAPGETHDRGWSSRGARRSGVTRLRGGAGEGVRVATRGSRHGALAMVRGCRRDGEVKGARERKRGSRRAGGDVTRHASGNLEHAGPRG
jgi:hypothetical protein